MVHPFSLSSFQQPIFLHLTSGAPSSHYSYYQLPPPQVSAFAYFISLLKLCPSIPTTRCPDAILQEEAPTAPRTIPEPFLGGAQDPSSLSGTRKSQFRGSKALPSSWFF